MKKTTTAILTIASFVFGSAAMATMDISKDYKVQAKDPAAKCTVCHKDAVPKKDGPKELNEFGATVKAAKGKDGKIEWSKVKLPAPPKA